MKLRTLSAKTLLLMVVLFGIVATAASLLAAFELRSQLLEEYRSKASALATTIAESEMDLIINRDYERLQSSIDQAVETPGVAYVYVEDESGEIVAHTFVPRVPDEVVSVRHPDDGLAIAELEIPGIGPILHVSAPILEGVAGRAHVGMELELIRARIWSAIVRVQLVIFVIFVVSVSVAFVLLRRISGPLREFSSYAQQLGKIDATHIELAGSAIRTSALRQQDEIGVLARSFVNLEQQLRDSIRRLRETTAEKERIESELKVAREIQRNILPREIPDAERGGRFELHAQVTAAREVAGDFYDFFLRPGGRLYFAVGDVSGKGVPASLFMAVTATLLRAAARDSDDPADIISRVNAELCRENDTAMFVTLFLGILDLATGRLDYCNGGHNPPFLISAGGAREIGEGGCVLVGCFDDVTYEGRTLTLAQGDSVFLFTDGVTEAISPDETLFGEGRLCETLSGAHDQTVRGLSQAVLAAVERHEAGGEPVDDVTLLALRYEAST